VPVLDGWTAIAAVAALTSRVRLGTLVTGVTHRNPAVLAKMAAMLDHVSAGRAVLGLGAAWNEDEHWAYGIPFGPIGERLGLLDEACQVVRSLFEREVTTFEGTAPSATRSSSPSRSRPGCRSSSTAAESG